MTKITIDERMGVSDIVSQISERIARRIINETTRMQTPQRRLGYYNCTPFVDGSFVLNTDSVIGDVNVEYMVYLCNDDHDYGLVLRSGALNCSADSDTNTLNVNTATVDGKVEDTLVGDIAHEVNHLYQYANGMTKNVNLYDSVVQVLQGNKVPLMEKAPVFVVYYTFKHEVDSFATQFYHMLIDKDDVVEFADAKGMFIPYNNLMKSYEAATRLDYVTLKRSVSHIGLTPKQWWHRVDSGMKRFDVKLRNVYHRYRLDRQWENRPVEGLIRRQGYLYEQYSLINEDMEPIYQFDTYLR